ncbi:MAG TPA: hypothetical protein VGH24_11715 [Solirubrobacteraceae bacterium]|jgi:hypothetical protein
MPQFCRHNHLIQNCTICSKEQDVEVRPVVSSSAPGSTQRVEPRAPAERKRSGPRARPGVRVHRLRTAVDDGYRSSLVPGLKSGEEAARLAEELAFAATRLEVLATEPPGLYAEVADRGGDLEERTWLAFLIAYLGPLEADDPFAAIRAVRTPWSARELPDLTAVETGPRSAHDPEHPTRTLGAYRAWAERAGSQAAALTGEPGWSPERRFARAFERLALPGLDRDARYELLTSLGRLGVYEIRPDRLFVGGRDRVTDGAKRALGIGDTMLLERRAAQLAQAAEVPLGALDLGLYNWELEPRVTAGLRPGAETDPALEQATHRALGA